MLKANVRHNISHRLVTKQIKKKVAEYEHHRAEAKTQAIHSRYAYARNPNWFTRKPQSDKEIDAMYDEWIKKEREYYAKVRIVHIDIGYVLVYGDRVDAEVIDGTGPFENIFKARSWFFSGGR